MSVDSIIKTERLDRIFGPEPGNAVIVALDNTSICGPEGALGDMPALLDTITTSGANGVIGFTGMFNAYPELLEGTSKIVNLTLSTEGPHHLRKVLVGNIERAMVLGADAVSVHVNTTSPHEPEMLTILGETAARCADYDLPLLAHMYPRRIVDGKEDHYADLRRDEPEEYARLVRHAATIAADIGADIIKVPFTGDAETFHTVVMSSYGVPILMAGGPKIGLVRFLAQTEAAFEAGAKGVAVGRSFFERPSQRARLNVLKSLVKQAASHT